MRFQYQLTNFKAFEDTGQLEMAPITVLCGANSSGKSSILKSILLVKQSAVERRSTLASDAPAQPLLFNGEWTRLGSWSETVFGKNRASEIGFHWRASGIYGQMLGRPGFAQRASKRISEGEYIYDLDVRLRSDPVAREELSAMLSSWTLNADGVVYGLSEASDAPSRSSIYRLKISDLGGMLRRVGARISLSTYNFGDLESVLAGARVEVACGNIIATMAGPFVTGLTPRLDQSWVPFFEQVVLLIRERRAGMRGPKPAWMTNIETGLRTFRRASADDAIGKPPTPTVRLLSRLASELVDEVAVVFEACRTALAPMFSQVRYLGPLRDQPRRFYQFDDTGGVDIGVSGEFTVQVLALEQGRRVHATTVAPAMADELRLGPPISSTLLEATNHWLEWMDLPAVRPASLQQSLYALRVGDLGVALPDVGFGVSQVLPIIVESLRADRDDLVILEQPEIHLHPRVQGMLADFLLARAQDGVRFLVESHSEYLVKRLCRRIAEGTVPAARADTNIVFVSRLENGTRCEPIALNEYGEVENWPSGFFDLNEDFHWTQSTLRRRLRDRARQ